MTLVDSFSFFLCVPFVAVGLAAVGWGVLTLLLHVASGAVSPLAWIAFAGYFYVVGRIWWSAAHPKRRRPFDPSA